MAGRDATSSTSRRAVAAAAAAAGTAAPATGKRAVIVGAGPAGALTAMLLAKQGFKVDVFEKLAPLVDEEGNVQASIGPRSYNILLSERAVTAIEAAGADMSGFDVTDIKASMRHKLNGGPTEGTSSMPPGRLKIANRGVLAGALVQQCLAQYPGLVQFHFEQELSAIDTQNSAVYFHPVGSAAHGAAMASATAGARSSSPAASEEGTNGGGGGGTAGGTAVLTTTTASGVEVVPPEVLTQHRTPASPDGLISYAYDLLVGADGANSVVRSVLQRYDSGLQAVLTRDVMEFKTCMLGPADQFLPPGKGSVGTFQTWSKLQATLIGSSTEDGQLRCVFILPGGVHDTLKSAADYEAYITKAIPCLPLDAVKRMAPQLVDSPLSNGGTIVRCTKLNSRRAVLVGDAGHSVYPALGQGANAALEGAAMLAATLEEVGTSDMEAAAAEYSRRWLPNALAVADLTEEGFGKNARAFAPNLKLAQLISQMLLHKVLPFLVHKPAFFQSARLSAAEQHGNFLCHDPEAQPAGVCAVQGSTDSWRGRHAGRAVALLWPGRTHSGWPGLKGSASLSTHLACWCVTAARAGPPGHFVFSPLAGLRVPGA